jgi:hypothetical protein
VNEEVWKPVVGYEGLYEVSNAGKVKSMPRNGRDGRVLKRQHNNKGYPQVSLCAVGVPRTALVHRLVLSAFVGQPAPGQEGCHNDGDRTNCELQNLRWDTRGGNMQDAVAHGTTTGGSKAANAKLTEQNVSAIRALLLLKVPQRRIAEQFGVCQEIISGIARGQRWKHIP